MPIFTIAPLWRSTSPLFGPNGKDVPGLVYEQMGCFLARLTARSAGFAASYGGIRPILRCVTSQFISKEDSTLGETEMTYGSREMHLEFLVSF